MKATINRSDLRTAMAALAPVIPRTGHIPVLSCVRLEANGRGLYMSGTGIDTWGRILVPGTVEGEGVALLEAAVLRQLADHGAGDLVELLMDGKDAHRGKSGATELLLPGMDPEDFPVIPDGSGRKSTEIAPSVLDTALRAVSWAAATEESRPGLRAVALQERGGRLRAAATNGTEAALYGTDVAAEKGMECLIPREYLPPVLGLLGRAEEPVRLSWGGGWVEVRSDGEMAVVRHGQGPYVNIDQVFPKRDAALVTAEVEVEGLARLMALAESAAPEATKRTKVEVLPDAIRVSAESSEGRRYNETMDAGVTGVKERFEIHVPAHKIARALKGIGAERVQWGFTEPGRATRMDPVDGDDRAVIVMPLRGDG